MSRLPAKLILLVLLLLAAATGLRAEQLPIRTYTAADGLAQNLVLRIVRDSRGYLWFCTAEGLSRFDGYKFTNYTTEQGLPHRSIRDLLETKAGVYWLATGAGLVRFDPEAARFRKDGRSMFVVYSPPGGPAEKSITVLYEDKSGALWCGTFNGLYKFEQRDGEFSFRFVDMGLPKDADPGSRIESMLQDRNGSLWVGTRSSGLYRRLPDGRIEHYGTKQGLPVDRVNALLEDRQGRLWVGTTLGLALMVPEPNPNQRAVVSVFDKQNSELPSDWIQTLFQAADGRLWVGLSEGLSELTFVGDSNEPTFRSYRSNQGLSAIDLTALSEDGAGNLWIGTTAGAMKLARNGFVTYSEMPGQVPFGVEGIVESRAGELIFIVGGRDRRALFKYDEKGLSIVRPKFPRHIKYFGWGWNQVGLQDRFGEWWIPTGQGLCRFPKVDRVEQLGHTTPKAVYTKTDGLTQDHVWRIYEDSRGDIWLETASEIGTAITRWERATESFHTYTAVDGLPAKAWATAFAEDRSGNVWIAIGNTLARYTSGHFKLFTSAEGLPSGGINDLHLDRQGRLWIASDTGGVSRLDDSQADQPGFITYTTANGLTSNQVFNISSDLSGRIYCFSGRGLDRLDTVTGQVKHYNTADGLVRGAPKAAFRDQGGSLWFASDLGLSRLIPEMDSSEAAPPILISDVRIGGERYPLSELGETNVSEIRLGPNENQIQIDFVGLSFGTAEQVKYQFKLEGADTEWTAPTEQRSVHYARLAPGSYRFLVRAMRDGNAVSQSPATVAFTIMPPLWQRWWFLILVTVSIGLMAYTLYRYRLARLLELERVRTRIATDLHDDIGSNLSLIAMASEVASRQAQSVDDRMAGWLTLISSTSRETVDSMSDIVWAVNPAKDRLVDLIQRMRRVAEETLTTRNIAFHFRTPEKDAEMRLGAETRREVFMVFKEGVNNIVRHSKSTRADLSMTVAGSLLVLQLIDNGLGFDPSSVEEGNGLASMRRRADKLRGKFETDSQPGGGTTITLTVPLDGQRRFRKT